MQQNRSILEVLEDFRKPDLADIGDLFGRDMPARMRKAEMARELAVYLTGSPAEWLDYMLERDLMLLSKLVDLGPGQRLRMSYPDYPTVVEITGIVDWDDSDENFHQVWLREEMWRVIRPHVAKAIRKGRDSGRFELERVMLGYANLYGAMPYEMFLDRIIDYFERTFGPDLTVLGQYLHRNPYLKLCCFQDPSDQARFLCAPGVENADLLFSKREKYPDIADYPAYTDADALAAGGDAPYFTYGLETPEGKAVSQMLQRLGYTGEDLTWELHEIWMCAQDPEENQALFDAVLRRSDWIVSQAEYNHCMELVAAYANICPKWYLNGHTSEDTGYLRVTVDAAADPVPAEAQEQTSWEMPHPTISEGYSDLIETNPRLDALIAMMPQGFPFGMAIPHVAGDDPCPCGSGLTYAHCHGRFKS